MDIKFNFLALVNILIIIIKDSYNVQENVSNIIIITTYYYIRTSSAGIL